MDIGAADKERRKDLRLFIGKPLVLKFHIKKRKGLFRFLPKGISRADNMSVGGIAVELPALSRREIEGVINEDDQIVLEFDIPAFKKALRVTGKVAWLKKKDKTGRTVYVTGLSFQNLKEAEREQLLLHLLNICLKEEVKV